MGALQRRLSRGQWRRWQLYFEAEPWGGVQDDLRAGYLAALTFNAHRGNASALQPHDFFPSLTPPRRIRTAATVRREILQWRAYALSQRNGKVIE